VEGKKYRDDPGGKRKNENTKKRRGVRRQFCEHSWSQINGNAEGKWDGTAVVGWERSETDAIDERGILKNTPGGTNEDARQKVSGLAKL